jgi:hypothetical protein
MCVDDDDTRLPWIRAVPVCSCIAWLTVGKESRTRRRSLAVVSLEGHQSVFQLAAFTVIVCDYYVTVFACRFVFNSSCLLIFPETDVRGFTITYQLSNPRIVCFSFRDRLTIDSRQNIVTNVFDLFY